MRKLLPLLLALILVGCGASQSGGTPPATSAPEEITESPQTSTPADTVEAKEEAVGATTEPEKSPEKSDGVEATAAEPDHAEILNQVLLGRNGADALAQIRESGDTRFVAGLIDTLRYRRDLREDVAFTLNKLTGEQLDADWFAWHEWAGNHPEIESFEGYVGWKANLFAQIDPNFLRFVRADVKVSSDSRVEEIVWGGVRVDGIPALDNPTMIDPAEADYLVPQERVFGVSINGDTRAYPARFLDWHEMFNDVVGGEPVSLAY